MGLNDLKIISLKYIHIAVIDNPYFFNIINFIEYKFDKEEYVNTIIIVLGHLSNVAPILREKFPEKRIVSYNWEQMYDGNPWMDIDTICNNLTQADEIWDYDELNSRYMQLYKGINVSKIYPMEFYPKMECIHNTENPEYDVLFYGFFNNRRAKVLSDLHMQSYNDFNFNIFVGGTVEQNIKKIANSKIVLNIHASGGYNRQEQERIGFLVGNKKCVISETSQLNYFGGAIKETNVKNLYYAICDMLDGDKWREFGEKGYETFKNGKCNKIENIR